jgi:hypothetical protein
MRAFALKISSCHCHICRWTWTTKLGMSSRVGNHFVEIIPPYENEAKK